MLKPSPAHSDIPDAVDEPRRRSVGRTVGITAYGIVAGIVGGAVGLPAVFLMAAVVVFVSCLGALVVNDRNVALALAPPEVGG